MRTVAPRIEGTEEVTVAEDQLDFIPVTVAYTPDGARICRWTFTPEERARVFAGEDLYFGTPANIQLTPHWLKVGYP